MHNAHYNNLKKIKKYGQLINAPLLFILNDDERGFDLNKQIEAAPKGSIIIYRNFGQEINNNISKKVKAKQCLSFATCSPKIAKQKGLKGIHIPNKKLKDYKKIDLKNLKTSSSAHNNKEILKAKAKGIDFIIYSPIFPSKSKSAKKIKGIFKLLNVTKAFKANIIALGGINIKTTKRLRNTRIKGIAGVSFD